ncbi:MAG: polyprenyl synthetase family protein [Calditrichaeota bacterium]|nr:polyprenyl synthetase family protein [Candidatus Cloacimonadota bacterium]MCB1045579.1 polyprenyl synthetase family protein [Calditrichota bacterium]MCB9473276.1 polyprenyl synthetase family protein [Candidatus Delongbacteria bacterium]
MPALSLKDIQRLVEPELKAFAGRYDDFIQTTGTPIVDRIIVFLGPGRGKLLRPTLTYLSARLLGESNERTHFAAVVVELLHNATLMHDDVVDKSDRRRGLPSLNSVFGNKISVLFGDWLLAHSLLGMLECGDTRVFAVLAETARRLAKGELDQAARSRNLDMDEETYYRMVSNKTGALLGAACRLGGLSNGADEDQLAALQTFGETIGIAFQIQDDLLDYTGSESLIGKPAGADLKDGKITLPLLYAFDRSAGSEVRQIKALIKGRKRGDIRRAVEFAHEKGGVDAAHRRARELGEQALACLEIFPDTGIRQSLVDFSAFAVNRTY